MQPYATAFCAALNSSVVRTLSRSFSLSFSNAFFRPSSSRSRNRTVSPDRVLNLFIKLFY